MATTGTTIRATGLTKRYGPVTALDDLTLDVPAGVAGLVGANGAGKSTLIKILLGLLEPTAGSARVLGLDVAEDGLAVRARTGYMPEHDCLPPDVTATGFVVHLARMSGLPQTSARERTADVLRLVGLHEERYRLIGQYSTGMRQRVKLALALVGAPDLVLLDEPTNGLDPAGRDEMLALIRHVGTALGISVLVTSHLLGELEQVCDHLVVVDGGRLLRSSSLAEATTDEAVLAVEVTEQAAALTAALRAGGLEVGTEGALLLVGLRDERTVDEVRDRVAELGVGLVRLQRRRHRLSEIFSDPAPPAPAPAPASAPASAPHPGGAP